MEIPNALYVFSYAFPACLAVIQLISIARVVFSVLYTELPARHMTITLRNTATSANTILFSYLFFAFSYMISDSVYWVSADTWAGVLGLSRLFLSLSIAFYVQLSHIRTIKAMKGRLSAATGSFLSYLTCILPLLVFIPFIITYLPIQPDIRLYIYIGISLVLAGVFICLDILFLFFFIGQVVKMEQEINVDAQINTIAKYGLFASIMFILIFILSAARLILELFAISKNQSTSDYNLTTILIATSINILLFIHMLIMIRMKITLIFGIVESGAVQKIIMVAAASNAIDLPQQLKSQIIFNQQLPPLPPIISLEPSVHSSQPSTLELNPPRRKSIIPAYLQSRHVMSIDELNQSQSKSNHEPGLGSSRQLNEGAPESPSNLSSKSKLKPSVNPALFGSGWSVSSVQSDRGMAKITGRKSLRKSVRKSSAAQRKQSLHDQGVSFSVDFDVKFEAGAVEDSADNYLNSSRSIPKDIVRSRTSSFHSNVVRNNLQEISRGTYESTAGNTSN